ncbi:MAG: Bax inhibitor-1/YccA family protein [Pelosinus sp.]|nr:Bax inhibitor-1/YccA family protein [Pelosinus sp.]
MKTSNPIFKSDVFTRPQGMYASEVMTISGTVNKSLFLLFLIVLSSFATWLYLMMTHNFQSVTLFAGTGIVATLILGFIAIFKPTSCPVIAPLYAVFEGFALGSITTLLSLRYGSIAFQAVSLTLGVALAMLASYKFGLIQVTDKFRSIVTAAIGGIFLVYMAKMILGFFNIPIPFLQGGLFGIAFSLIVIGIAALSLILDFDNIYQGARSGAPAYMEWVGAFGLMVTLVWLYWEIIRLIMILRDGGDN